MKIKYISFYLIVIFLFIVIVGPSLFSDGMFMDGLLYAAISKNIADNLGSFWDLHLTSTLYPHFHEHPPLAFGIQSLFFKLFGESIFVERFYSFITFIITGWIITRIWKKITISNLHSLAWLPLLFWISIPLITWSAANNMLENTMMIFTSLSVLFILKSLDSKRILFLSLSGLMLFFGFLTKGFVALFPLSMPLWIYIFKRNINLKRFIIDTLVLFIATLIPLLIIYIIMPESIDSLTAYFNKQIIGSIENVQTVNNRFYILWRLINELIPAGILVLIIFIFFRNKKIDKRKSKWIFVFLALGLSGVIPIMISLKQSGFYILSTFPFFSIAIAYFIAPHVSHLVHKINTQSIGYKIFKIISYLFLIVSIIIITTQSNRIGRDKNKVVDVYKIIEIVSKNSTISIQKNLWNDWSLHGYFSRYANISLDDKKQNSHKYFLINKDGNDSLLMEYQKVSVDLKLFDLYEKIK